MNLIFSYNKEKDIDCILRVGPKSSNSPNPTETYKKIVSQYGENPSREQISEFIDKYIEGRKYTADEYISKYQKDFDEIKDRYIKSAEKVFGVKLDENVTAYLTAAGRYPYNLEQYFFFVGFGGRSNPVAIHELWHFYTWKVFGLEEERKIGMKKYNDIKESLTVLLNLECQDILEEEDEGYPQHQEYRKEISKLWKEGKDIKDIWNHMVKVLDNES